MGRVWHQNAVIYQIDPSRFYDSNNDGWGDIPGIIEKLDYLVSLGVSAIWLTPFYLSPRRDNGYDVADHLQPDPRLGTMQDIERLITAARRHDIALIIELVAQHTSDQHPWFQQARTQRDSPYHDFYLWSDSAGPDQPPPVFPTVEAHIWHRDAVAQRYYRHLFYHYEPDLNLTHPQVLAEIDRILLHWANKGVAGFRIDAASHMVEQAGAGDKQRGYRFFNHIHDLLHKQRPEMMLLGEVDVNVAEFNDYFGDGDRLTTLLNFWINKNIFLALARERAEPLLKALCELPLPPEHGGYCFWLRNHDELDLEDLSPEDYDFVMSKYAPAENMRIYGRGLRRRLAPMLNGDERHQALAHALLFSLPGTPVVRYGAEIGMGDDLSLPEREAVRTPMQWSDAAGAGFSRADPGKFVAPLISDSPFSYRQINVAEQQARPGSLLARISEMARVWRTLPEVCFHRFQSLQVSDPAVVAVSYQHDQGRTLMFANLSAQATEIRVEGITLTGAQPLLADENYPPVINQRLALNGHGYRWLRLGEALAAAE